MDRELMGKIVNYAVIVGFLLLVGFPLVQLLRSRPLFTESELITVSEGPSTTTTPEGRELELITLLDFDAIRAILKPSFVTPFEAEEWMDPDEQLLSLSMGGDHRAYPIRMLSRHEIVNDVVGGKPVVVTW